MPCASRGDILRWAGRAEAYTQYHEETAGDMETPEGQDWQRECVKCGKVKCPKVEKVSEWLRGATDDTFKYVEEFAREDPRFTSGLREQAGKYSVMMELHLVAWSRCLEGVCFDCQEEAFPEEEERLGDPEWMQAEHWRRWAFAAPLVAEQKKRDAIRAEVLEDVAATSLVGKEIAASLRPPLTARIITKDGEKEVPCAWARGGLVVVMLGEANLEKARAERAEGKEGVYPTQAWSITHAASELALVQSFDMPDDAVEAARRLLPLADWRLPVDELTEVLKANPKVAGALAMENARQNMF